MRLEVDPTRARPFDVVCAGEALWHLVSPGRVGARAEAPLRFRPGGGAVSVAVALARRGLHVGLATSLTDDRAGRRLRARIAGAGVDVDGVVLAAPRTGIVVLDGSHATRPIVSYRDEEQPAVVPDAWSSQVLLLSGLSPVVANAASFCKAARAARRAGTVVAVDVNARRHVWAGRDPRASRMALREADVVHASTEDLDALGIDDAGLRSWTRPSAVLVVSDGLGSGWAVGPFGETRRPAPAFAGYPPARRDDSVTVSLCIELVRAGRPCENRGDVWERVTSPERRRDHGGATVCHPVAHDC
jgi:sugar/nucleoside kinase (ribokinase family)